MIAWVDVETTGLDAQTDKLLEVGVILTDDGLCEISRTVVRLDVGGCLAQLDHKPELVKMHTESGLVQDCDQSGLWLSKAQSHLCTWLCAHIYEPPTMAGSTVGFDRAFLKTRMPELERLFHYRSIDVSSLKELNTRWGFAPPWTGDRKIHRVLPDLEDSIDELRHYRSALGV